ncbi:MAG: GNAT family N-acetyltransferase [Nitrospinales bacterium]
MGWLYIDVLWVEERYRSKGLGTRLINAAEDEAISRKCCAAYLYTYSYQNPKFYERLGYHIFGQLNNFPDQHTKYFMFFII